MQTEEYVNITFCVKLLLCNHWMTHKLCKVCSSPRSLTCMRAKCLCSVFVFLTPACCYMKLGSSETLKRQKLPTDCWEKLHGSNCLERSLMKLEGEVQTLLIMQKRTNRLIHGSQTAPDSNRWKCLFFLIKNGLKHSFMFYNTTQCRTTHMYCITKCSVRQNKVNHDLITMISSLSVIKETVPTSTWSQRAVGSWCWSLMRNTLGLFKHLLYDQ